MATGTNRLSHQAPSIRESRIQQANPPASDVFLSYSSVDKTTADSVCAVLEQDGIRCWMAPRDILPGREWAESIVDAIAGSRMMVVIFSSQANMSQHVLREVEQAVHRGLVIIPFRIEDVLPTQSMAYFLRMPHWLDAMTPPLEAHIRKLSNSVQLILKQNTGKVLVEEPESRIAIKHAGLKAITTESTPEVPADQWNQRPNPGPFRRLLKRIMG